MREIELPPMQIPLLILVPGNHLVKEMCDTVSLFSVSMPFAISSQCTEIFVTMD